MSVFKCKMCGGTLNIKEGSSVAECQYCGTKQTIPKLDDETRVNLYDRANHFRRNNDYDKAMAIYEQLLETDKTEAEAYWSILLCKYGIEYVEDPKTHKVFPTINRMQYTSVFSDEDYKSAIKFADNSQRIIYQEEAKQFDNIQRDIIAISQKENPYDIFICYKETDENGKRTQDSVLAQDLYYQLVKEGYKVFFSRITLEDKLGTEYEPYIFAALNSAKVMVVLGTNRDNFNSVWVKNEWSRFLAIIKKDHTKVLIPAYRDMDPYDLPEEFSHLQAQDMSKLGFMQDLIRGINKIVFFDSNGQYGNNVVDPQNNANYNSLLRSAAIFLEDKDWKRANDCFEKVLDKNPENAEAYFGKFMVDFKISKQNEISSLTIPINDNVNFKRAVKFADERQQKLYLSYADEINNNRENSKLTKKVARKEKNNAQSKKKRKTIVIIAAVLVCVAAILTTTLCLTLPANKETVDGMIFVKNAGEYELVGTNSKIGSEVVVPEKIKKLNVTSIREGAFSGNSNITSVEILDNITNIGKDVFKNCCNLESVTIGNGVTTLPDGLFCGCGSLVSIKLPSLSDNLGKVFGTSSYEGGCATSQYSNKMALYVTYYIPSSLRSVTITSGNIADCAFYNCSNITSVTIPNNATSIGTSAFYNCSKLGKIKISTGVKNIGEDAFVNCGSLTSITIPDNVTSLSEGVFSGCGLLESVKLPFVGANKTATEASVSTLFGYIFGKTAYANGEKTIQRFCDGEVDESCETYYIPTSLKTITITGGDVFYGAFSNCRNLTNIELPNGVTKIEDKTFLSCANLNSISIPNGVVSIGDMAFLSCECLTSIEMPDSLIKIGTMAFMNCKSVTNFKIGNGVDSIGKTAFYGCSKLNGITFKDATTWYIIDNETDWEYKASGIEIDVTNDAQNVTKFAENYDYYWYKL